MNPAFNAYEPAPLPAVESWHWLLSIAVRAATPHINIEADKVSADEEMAQFNLCFWEVTSPQQLVNAFRAMADQLEEAIR
jgi:hypothetical protein